MFPAVTLVRAVRDDKHPVELYDLLFEDVPDESEYADAGGLERRLGPLCMSGTFARAGAGWLQGNSAEDIVRVRIEFHDGTPVDDREAWTDVLETPYLCR